MGSSANIDAAKGAKEICDRIITKLRSVWPNTHIIVRADSGFYRDELLCWCEGTNGVDYVIGLAKNPRLKSMLAKPAERARREHLRAGDASRAFKEIRHRTQKTWSCTRRVISKAEHLSKGANPRFVVTSLSSQGI
ncbi:MAG: transposase [Myxococcales bacterium]|nr:transposase [Myxococcales bacterium]